MLRIGGANEIGNGLKEYFIGRSCPCCNDFCGILSDSNCYSRCAAAAVQVEAIRKAAKRRRSYEDNV